MPDAQTLPTSFNITATGSGDAVIGITATGGANSVDYKITHDEAGTVYTSGNTVTSIGAGESKTIKVPQITVDKYGHTNTAADENVTITIPAAPQVQSIKVTDDNIVNLETSKSGTEITITGSHKKYSDATEASVVGEGGTVTIADATSIPTINIPSLTVDQYGHVIAEEVPLKFTPIDFNTDYNASTNKAATMTDISNEIKKLDVTAVNFSESETIKTISETDGKISASKQTIKIPYTNITNWETGINEAFAERNSSAPSTYTDATGTKVNVVSNVSITDGRLGATGAAINFNTALSTTNKAATMEDVTKAVADLNGAMHFKGVVTTEPNGTTPTGYKAGDIVIYQQKNTEGVVTVAIEYVFDGTTWYKLGDESLPQKIVDAAIAELDLGTITNDGNVDSASVDIITSLSQNDGVVGGTKETLNFNTAPTTSNKIATITDITNKINALDVTGVDLTQAETINVLKQTNGKISVSKQSILITSDQVSDFDDRVGNSINELDWAGLDLTPGETINTISQTDGKVTGTKQTIAITASQVTDFATEVGKLFPNISVTTDDDGMAKVSATATGHSLTINTSHAEVGSATTSTANSGSVSGYGASKTISIPRVSTDKWGHVTSITNDSVAITMPSVSDTKMTQTVKADNVNYPLLAAASASPTSGAASTGVYDTGMTMNPSTNTIKATIFQGNLDGVADAAQLLSDSGSNPLTVGTTTRPVYFNAGKPTALTEDVAPHRAGIYFVKDTAGASTTAGTWKAQCSDITEYYDGLTIALQVPIAGASTTTLNINDLGGKTVYRYSTTKVTTQYAVDTVIILVYSATKNAWYTTDYDSNTYVTQAYSTSNANYPILLTKTSGITSTSSRGSTTTILNNQIYANPSTGTITATGGFIGNADSASYADIAGALASSAGSLTNPIYFKDGKPIGCTYELNKTVPSNAVFTDTKVNTTLGTTTKAYLLGTTTTPTNTAQGVTAIADTGVYLDTTAGTLTATTFKGNLNGNASSADLADAVQGTLKIQANGTDKISYNGSTSPTLNIATGSTNGTISVGGTNVSVKGLGSNAYSSTSHLPTAGGTITGDILFDASGTTQANEPALTWGGIGTASPFIGYADDQNDGTFLLMSLAGGSSYKNGLAIGGSSGSLLWKGSKVTTVDDIGELDYADTEVAKQYVSEVDQTNGLISVKRTPLPVAAGNSTGIVKGFHHTTGTATGTKTTNATNAPAVNARSTTSGKYYGVETDATGAMYVNVPWTDTNSDTKVKQSPCTTDGEFPILLRGTSAGTTETTTTASFKTTTTINPSTGRISIKTSEPTIYGSYGAADVNLIEGDYDATYTSHGILYSNNGNGANMFYNSTEKCITFEFY